MAKRRAKRRGAKASPPSPPPPADEPSVAAELERTLAAGCRAVRERQAFTADNLDVLRLAKEYVFTRAKLDLERQAIELGDAAADGLPAGFDPLGALKVRARDG